MSGDPLGLLDEWGLEKVVLVSDRRCGMREVLVINNTARGAGKGGIPMSPTLTTGEVARLARIMTWKWPAVDLFPGGAKAGVLGDPWAGDQEQILRAFIRALAKEVPSECVSGLDMGLAEEDAAIFVDELHDRGVSTGLPWVLGGLPYDQLGVTGFGVAEATDTAASTIDLKHVGVRVAIQGIRRGRPRLRGPVDLARRGRGRGVDRHRFGARPDGLEVAELSAAVAALGDHGLDQHRSFSPRHQDLLSAEVDVLIPAARENTIDATVAGSTTARLIVEGANLPTSPAAQQILHGRGVFVLPDFIANAGGTVAAAHSTDARYSPFAVDPAAMFTMITEKLRSNTSRVLADRLRKGSTPRHAAVELAQSRVLAAMTARGYRRSPSAPAQAVVAA